MSLVEQHKTRASELRSFRSAWAATGDRAAASFQSPLRASGSARPLDIVVPIHSFDPGGVERVALALALEWKKAGHNVTVVLGRNAGADRDLAPELDYWRMDSAVDTAGFETIWMISCLYRYLQGSPADVVFCAGNTYAIVGAAVRGLLGEQCPPLMLKISNDLQRRDMNPVFRAAYGLWLTAQGLIFDRFISMASAMVPEIVKTSGVSANRVSVVGDASISNARLETLAALPPRAKSPWGTHYVAVGRLAGQKNVALMIKAFARQARPGDKLTIAGEGPDRKALEALIAKLGMADRVCLKGHLLCTDALLAEADAFVLSSDYEGLPAVIVEALAAGLPIVATDCSSAMSSLLDGGRQGILVPIGDEAALSAALNRIRDFAFDRDMSRRMAANYTLERAAQQYLAVMADVVSERVASAAPYPAAVGLSA